MNTPYMDKIRDIAVHTFEVACYLFPLEDWELDGEEAIDKPDGSKRAIVHFEGAATGGMVINTSKNLLDAIAANMLGVEEATDKDKDGALCEIANIICGNTVPLFAKNENICYIRPPRMAEPGEDLDVLFKNMKYDQLEIILDEGIAHISIYYETEGTG